MGAALCTNNQVVNDTIKSNQVEFNFKVKGIWQRLWLAVQQNNKINLQKFLDFNDVTESTLYDEDGQSVLHLAASLGHVEMLMMLIERTGAKPDLTNASLQTPLHVACEQNKLSVVKFLSSCIDGNIQDEQGQTPIYVCCSLGYYEIVSYFIEANSSGQLTEALEIDLANYVGMTPLICAITRGDLQIVKLLVQKGSADINQSNLNGETPIITACKLSHADIIEFLIQKGCSILKQDILGCTLLHYIGERGSIQVLKLLASLGIDTTVVEVPDNAGRTPLFAVIENMEESDEWIELLKLILESQSNGGFKANPNVIDYSGRTPLFVAASKGLFQTVKILIEAGAQPDFNNGEVVLEESHITELFKQQKNFYTAYLNCQTALQISTVLGFDQITAFLQTKADVNFKTSSKKYTVLHLSVLANRPEMLMQFLNQTNADPMIEDCNGKTCLDLIYELIPEYVDTLQQLLEQRKDNKTNDQLERVITGAQSNQITTMYTKQDEGLIDINKLTESDLQVEGQQANENIELLFGRKVALCLLSQNWQYKESAIKFVLKHTEKLLARTEKEFKYLPFTLVQLVDSTLTAVSLTCRDKVIKVSQISLQLFNAVVQSTRVERDEIATKKVIRNLKQNDLVTCLLLHSEISNTRVTTKIHEALIDLAYQTHLGGLDLVVNAVFLQLAKQKTQKGLLAHLTILHKIVTTFPVQKQQGQDQGEYDNEYDPEYYAEEEVKSLITKESILVGVLPSLSHLKEDVRQAAIKILVEVQKQTGELQKIDFECLNEQQQESIWQQIEHVQTQEQHSQNQEHVVDNVLDKYKLILDEKGLSKDWTQREQAIQSLQELFTQQNQNINFDDEFLYKCILLIQQSLDDNNIQIYLLSIDLLLVFMLKVQTSVTLCESLPQILTSVVLRTTDTNTRVRKRSVEVIKQAWSLILNKQNAQSACQICADVVCDTQLNDKAIVGRIGILIKKCQEIESSEDLDHKSILQQIGKDYDQLMQFGCQWSQHKNTKVRQSALKLIVEICRLNSIDPKGAPFKQRIVSYIMGLRSQVKDPLIQKVNQVCKDANPEALMQFISEADYVNKNQVNKAKDDKALPVISNNSVTTKATTVLPHSEPLSETLLQQGQSMIELFGLNIVTCFYSQSWSTRVAAIQKIKEQLHNLNLATRDAMTCEINKQNLPPELTIKPMLELITEGLKDPVVKINICILDLIQSVLPIYQQQLTKSILENLVQQVITKLSDLKPKVRESTINLCLFLAHLTWIGPEFIANVIFNEFEQLQWNKQDQSKKDMNQFGNSNMIVSCLQILQHLQTQNQLVKSSESKLLKQYSQQVQRALLHQNPQVRKEGEALFKILYSDWNETQVTEQLSELKPSVIQKLLGSTNDKLDNQFITEFTDWNQISKVLDQNQINEIKNKNVQKRLQAVREVKKTLQQRSLSRESDLVEPITLLVLYLLRDDNQEVMQEVLQILKFVVSNLAQHLSQLDLHLVIGQFISQLVQKPVTNLKFRVASDKVIVCFAKNTNVGSLVVAKEIIKNIERLNKQSNTDVLLRLYNLLLMLVQQYSIILCYQPQFYTKMLETIADSQSKFQETPVLNSALYQFIVFLYQIDAKLLNDRVQQLEFQKRTNLRKIIIELDNQSVKGLVHNIKCGISIQSPVESMRDTLSSFQSQQTQLLSPKLNMTRRLSRQSNRQSETPENIQLPKTGMSWLERKNTTQETTLPIIETKSATVQRRQLGQGYVHSSSKPAGFNSQMDSTQNKLGMNDQSVTNQTGLYMPTQRFIVKPQNSYQPTAFSKQGVTTVGSFGLSSTRSTFKPLFAQRQLGNQTN